MNKETIIQQEIQKYLNKHRIFNYRVNADENTVGIPDLIVCYHGMFLGIEVKTPIGKLSDMQKEVRDRIIESGGYFTAPTSVDEVIDVLKEIDKCLGFTNKKL